MEQRTPSWTREDVGRAGSERASNPSQVEIVGIPTRYTGAETEAIPGQPVAEANTKAQSESVPVLLEQPTPSGRSSKNAGAVSPAQALTTKFVEFVTTTNPDQVLKQRMSILMVEVTKAYFTGHALTELPGEIYIPVQPEVARHYFGDMPIEWDLTVKVTGLDLKHKSMWW